MARKVGSRMLGIGVHGGGKSRQIGKFFFVPQVLQEFDAHEFTVSVNIGVEDVCLKQDSAVVFDSRAHAKASNSGKGLWS
jgi:hypothetical protein